LVKAFEQLDVTIRHLRRPERCRDNQREGVLPAGCPGIA